MSPRQRRASARRLNSRRPRPPGRRARSTLLRATLDTYCVTCHNQRLKTAGLTLDAVDAASPHANPEIWEKVIARLRAGTMPPAGRPRPDAATAQSIAAWIEADIDRAWLASPVSGRVSAVHRLNRTQYSNAVRDLFALDPQAFDVTVTAARRRNRRRQLR